MSSSACPVWPVFLNSAAKSPDTSCAADTSYAAEGEPDSLSRSAE